MYVPLNTCIHAYKKLYVYKYEYLARNYICATT